LEIIGTDGHQISGEFSFTVETLGETVQEEEQLEESSTKTENLHQGKKGEVVNVSLNNQENDKIPAILLPSISVGLLIVGIGFFWWLVRRK
jgi:hypothetical protein